MTGYQRKYLKGLAHGLKPTVLIGQKGLQTSVFAAVEAALNRHELIKIKFVDFKQKALKEEMSAAIEKETGARRVAVIGHTTILYRQHPDPVKRRIHLPERQNAPHRD